MILSHPPTSCPGHAAMEAAVVNLLEVGDVALVCQNGVWGVRLADMVERNGKFYEQKHDGEIVSSAL